MKILRVDFDDEAMPKSAQFELTVTEMVLLYNLTGRVGPRFVTEASGGHQIFGEASDDIASCLSGNFFNRYWENGVDGAGPRFGISEIAARQAAHTEGLKPT